MYFLKQYKWFRKWRGGIWYKHQFSIHAEQLTFAEVGTWWARYDKINRYSHVIDKEDYTVSYCSGIGIPKA